MDYNLITEKPIRDGFGLIYQGGWFGRGLWSLEMPIFVVQMDEYHDEHRFIHHRRGFIGVLSLRILDCPEPLPEQPEHGGNAIGPLPDYEYLAAVDCIIGYLSRGVNVYIHCAAGVSRSSYMTLGVLMRTMDLSFDEALAYLRSRRPKADPNRGFVAHLRRLEGALRSS
jgi:hypothetical protein